MNPREQIFKNIFNERFWGGNSASGPASDLPYTQNLRKFILEFIEKYKIKTILDAPCGDMFWFSTLNIGKVKYYGYDIVDEIIKENKEKFKEKKNYIFEKKDLIVDSLPKVDLILCRDLIIHFPTVSVYDLIQNFIKSKSKYLLITHHIVLNNPDSVNFDIKFGAFTCVNLTMPPFNFPIPKMLIPEEWSNKNILRNMALYELEDLNKFLNNNC